MAFTRSDPVFYFGSGSCQSATLVPQGKEARGKLEEMYAERSGQVEDTMKRLAHKEAKIIELQAAVSSLQTTNEMLQTDSGMDRKQAEFLAAMESDKVLIFPILKTSTNYP